MKEDSIKNNNPKTIIKLQKYSLDSSTGLILMVFYNMYFQQWLQIQSKTLFKLESEIAKILTAFTSGTSRIRKTKTVLTF